MRHRLGLQYGNIIFQNPSAGTSWAIIDSALAERLGRLPEFDQVCWRNCPRTVWCINKFSINIKISRTVSTAIWLVLSIETLLYSPIAPFSMRCPPPAFPQPALANLAFVEF